MPVYKGSMQAVKMGSSTNFIVQLMLSGSLMELWGLVRALQLLIMASLLRIPLPAHVNQFYDILLYVASMDLFQGETIIGENF